MVSISPREPLVKDIVSLCKTNRVPRYV